MRTYLINLKKKEWLIMDEKPERGFDVLLQVLLQEKSDRLVRAKYNRIRAANFPEKKLLEELQEKELPDEAQRKLPHLKSLDFIK